MQNIVNEICNTGKGKVKYYGSKKQCLEKPVKTIILSDSYQSFSSREIMDLIENWKSEVKSELLYPFPLIQNIDPSGSEAVIKDVRYNSYKLKDAVEGFKYRLDVSINTYSALKTLENSNFTRVFEITEDNEVLCEKQKDGKYKGRELTSFLLEQRTRATDEDVPFVNAVLKFANDEFSIVKPKDKIEKLEGIHGAYIEILTATQTEWTFKVFTEYSNNVVNGLQLNDLKSNKQNGVEQVFTAISEQNGVYTVTGVGLESGTLQTNGVLDFGEILLKADEVIVTVS